MTGLRRVVVEGRGLLVEGGGVGEPVVVAGPARLVGQQVRAQPDQRADGGVVGVGVVAGGDERAQLGEAGLGVRVPLLVRLPCPEDQFGQDRRDGGGRAGGRCGDRGGRGDIVEAAGAQGQFQRVEERSPVEAGPAAVAVGGGPVAGVEAGGEVVRAAPHLGVQAGHRPGAAGPSGGGQFTVAEVLDALEEHVHAGEEVELVQR
ncbi:hypothetical protein M2161_002090 [Streptomyces sp. SAI-133]|nr:hypothetical protein [Streptomyces sp. SAI-133]